VNYQFDRSGLLGMIQAVIAGPKEQTVTDCAALVRRRIGTTRGSTNNEEATTRAQGAQMVRYDGDAPLITAIVSGQVGLVATSSLVMDAPNGRNPPAPFETKIVMRTFPYAIGIRKGEARLQAALNEWGRGKDAGLTPTWPAAPATSRHCGPTEKDPKRCEC
jgi:polar amino acid transport system substrate-binding protein